jgi:hypothetical protein
MDLVGGQPSASDAVNTNHLPSQFRLGVLFSEILPPSSADWWPVVSIALVVIRVEKDLDVVIDQQLPTALHLVARSKSFLEPGSAR